MYVCMDIFFFANCPYVFKFVLNLIVSFIKADKKFARELKKRIQNDNNNLCLQYRRYY